ncbi:MAG: DNA primase large subunit PriL [Candidatus Methanofastidiosum methylothiophilum]|uniref:DNA primase large subunit PriL n=1 Tax=Candidatus Methanofastidiosum methylothiophilum TaxID=1705564 RepID=A0A150J0V6_9EURY|nr:MAG: DNA primase large subunit PriL [Candidatus Methanofastidiosum methylthiophilus]KYC48229.1 MAG: DNA primase large subunit PriL [Candidatus Methanofastidiosum methylthiophilus]KYC50886.1 MAG: DNA primase large subunit PriL [Candidatus Methanofastidiosum methylthiophilus]
MNPLLLNPFREEAKEYLGISFDEVSQDLLDFGINKIKTELDNTKDRKYLFPTGPDEKTDIISFYLFCQALSKRPFSSESRLFASTYAKVYRQRLSELLIQERGNKEKKEEIIATIKDIIDVILFKFPDITEILRHRAESSKNRDKKNSNVITEEPYVTIKNLDIKITDEVIRDLEKLKLIKISGQSRDSYLLPEYLIKWTDAETLVNLTESYILNGYIVVNDSILLKTFVKKMEQKILNYIKSIAEKTKDVKLPIYDEIFREISKISGFLSEIEVQSEELNPEVYPPCVIKALSGVGAGDRNYAITLFLSSFLSYSRIIPSTKIFSKDEKPSLNETQINILINEVIPLILSAANKCNPPFLEDQPQEELNIYYHLGFGLAYPTLDNFGRSKWYIPPGCAKVKENAPTLCEPDSFCKMYFYEVTKKELLDTLKGNTPGEKILLTLKDRMRTLNEIIQKTGLPEDEVKKQLLAFVKNKTVTARRINNPFMYYLRKKRALKRKADIIR